MGIATAFAPPPLEADPFDDGISSSIRHARLRNMSSAKAVEARHGVARLAGFDLDEVPLLDMRELIPGELVRAQTTVALQSRSIGARVVFVLEDGDSRRPIILGLIHEPGTGPHAALLDTAVTISADEQRFHFKAEREIVLECGAASITLTRAGKIIIKGSYVLSSSSGSNRIKGAVIDIN